MARLRKGRGGALWQRAEGLEWRERFRNPEWRREACARVAQASRGEG
ncbi:MAG: hypothetical protein P4L03_10415 [Terracidiphilus sp.]|nr:hypothetical protein [Terracidiphilus sp.]